jgi:hypothetical protein
MYSPKTILAATVAILALLPALANAAPRSAQAHTSREAAIERCSARSNAQWPVRGSGDIYTDTAHMRSYEACMVDLGLLP